MCKEKRICLNPYKSTFCIWKGQLLGHVISRNGMEMVEDKAYAILEAQTPYSAGAFYSFLGYANFYQRFTHHVTVLKAIPLYELTKKDAKFV